MGKRIAQTVTSFIGSWYCVFGFIVFCLIWMALNEFHVLNIDPEPFILLNLCLSTWAGIQCSIVMINQRYTQATNDESDRKRDEILQKLLEMEQRQMEMHEQQQHVKGLFSKWLK